MEYQDIYTRIPQLRGYGTQKVGGAAKAHILTLTGTTYATITNGLSTCYPNTGVASGQQLVSHLTSESIVKVLSTSANDTNAAGTGLRVIRIVGYNDAGTKISEDVEMNATTGKDTTIPFRTILWSECIPISVGLGGKNHGRIDVKQGSNFLGSMHSGTNCFQTCSMQVPAGYKATVLSTKVTGNYLTVNIIAGVYTRTATGPFQEVPGTFGLSSMTEREPLHNEYTAGLIIEGQCYDMSGAGGTCSMIVEVLMQPI